MGSWATVIISGCFIHRCLVGTITECDSLLNTELMGLTEDLRLANVMGCISAHFCSDSTDIIWSLNSGSMNPGCNAMLFEEGVLLLRNHPGWRIYHVLREDNLISDYLTRKARVETWTWNCEMAIPILSPDVSESLAAIG